MTMIALLTSAYNKQASDLHISVGTQPIIRINGALERITDNVLTPQATEEMAKEIIPVHLWQKFKEKGELDFSYAIPGLSRFRVNAYHQRSCISLAIRVVPVSIPTLDQLSLPKALAKVIEQPQGLFLVTGPTGSGKSTTLAAMIQQMNETLSKHIITLEDPIEYLHKHNRSIINQREIGFDTQNFANGLRAALRQDPDVILVGEMRDLETIQTAITAAETGHLVLGTLHTASAPSTINRMIDVFPADQQTQIRFQLASVLVGIFSQRLLPLKSGKGRTVATELLVNTAAVANLIRNEKIHQLINVMQTSREIGMHTIETSVTKLLQQELITQEVASPFIKERRRHG